MAEQELATPKVKTEEYTTSLFVKLSREEIADRAQGAAQKLNERDQREDEMKAAQKHAKGIIEEIEAEMRRLSHEVRTGSTYRQVTCERRYVYSEGVYQEVRLDTGEVIFTRRMTDAEKQMEFNFSIG